MLEVTKNALSLANSYYLKLQIPEKARADDLHVALSVIHGMDYMVTWNCTHIAAARVRAEIEMINIEFGYNTPVICTLEELMEV